MAHISLSSDNEGLSYIVQKNPNNPMMIKELRKGFLFTWFVNGTLLSIFTDRPGEMSFSNKEFEYLDTTALVSPHAYLAMLNDLFVSCIKVKHEKDVEGHKHVLTLGYVKCRDNYLSAFVKHYASSEDYSIETMGISPGCYLVAFHSSKGVHEVVNLAIIFSMFMAMKDDDQYLDLSTDLIAKYVRLAKSVGIPYYIGNIFKINFFRKGDIFDSMKAELESAITVPTQLTYGNLTDQRHQFIKGNVDPSMCVVDLGCGESRYAYFSRMLDDGLYWFPIDEDEEARFKTNRRIADKKLDKVTEPLNSWQDYLDADTQESIQVLMIEVLEHNPIEESSALLASVLNHPYVNRVVLSVPNKDFNKYYLLGDEETRHDDHDWEMTETEVTLWLLKVIPEGWVMNTYLIGDVVNEISKMSPTLGYVLTRK